MNSILERRVTGKRMGQRMVLIALLCDLWWITIIWLNQYVLIRAE
jgi:hypothetical protein